MSVEEPAVRVVRGTPTDEELAALVGAIMLRGRPQESDAPAGLSPWVRHARPGAVTGTGLPARPGIDAWRLSGLPR